MKSFKRNLLKLSVNIIVLLCSAVLCLGFIEVAIVCFGLDIASVQKNLYTIFGTAGEGPDFLRESDDYELLYELVPDARSFRQTRNPCDIDQSRQTISIDHLGFRSNGGVAHTKKKPDGVFRIIALGGSNTFGYCVSDSQTWPAQLEKVLNARFPGRFEVWNAGVSGYTMTQKVFYARKIMREYSPDLLLFQNHNISRRPFYRFFQGYAYFFRHNKDLWYENVPLIGVTSTPDPRFHQILVRNWALYRLCVSEYNNYLGDESVRSSCPLPCEYAVKKPFRVFSDFVFSCRQEKYPRIAMITSCDRGNEFSIAGLPELYLKDVVDAEKKPPEFYEIHPPSHVYEWYGEKIADWLINEKLISGE